MNGKFKSAIATIILTLSLADAALAQHQASLYSIVAYRDGSAGFCGLNNVMKNYVSVEVYLNNQSSDTLYYQGSDCDNLLFSIRSNRYFHLASDVCNQRNYLKALIPPHRSQKMQLYLTMEKAPDHDVSLLIQMDLYKWIDGAAGRGKGLLLGGLSDSTLLHFDSHHQRHGSMDDFEILRRKDKFILPNKDIYLLTDNDRKLYTLTVENARISAQRDTLVVAFKDHKPKKVKAVTVPVILHNNSGDTLKFYLMDCSWFLFFGTNRHDIWLPGWDCLKNKPDIVTIAPHKDYLRNLNITYYADVKSGSRYQISMSLLKDTGPIKGVLFFWPDDYVRFNQIWSNEITIP